MSKLEIAVALLLISIACALLWHAYVNHFCEISGDDISAAYRRLPPEGGPIVIKPKVDGTCYLVTTPIPRKEAANGR